jgi:antibiotic biosynthesis monooxygenase (ABM) superfamily enzyme
MFTRCAFFRGRVKPGQQDAFDTHIKTELVALWTRFPKVQDVRLLREVESDAPGTHFELVIQMQFATREAIAEALASDVRWQSKAASQRLFELFDGDVFHTVFTTDPLPLPDA